MSQLLDAIRSGYYARNQIYSRSRLISWSHRGRFAMGLDLARTVGGARVLDYGCGDGTFLALLMQQDAAPRLAIGAELHSTVVDECRVRFAGQDGLRFMSVDELDHSGEQGCYDAIYCMEVFEHVVEPIPVLDRLERLLAPGGSVVISVPIETGLPVVLKQMVRRVAGWRGIGHYPGTTGYSFPELVRSVFAGSSQHVERPVFLTAAGTPFHDHKGFNWRVLRELIDQRFDMTHQATSPVAWLGPQLGTQRWFVAGKKR